MRLEGSLRQPQASTNLANLAFASRCQRDAVNDCCGVAAVALIFPLLGKAIGLSVVLSIAVGVTLSVIAFLQTFEPRIDRLSRPRWLSCGASHKRLPSRRAISDAVAAYQRLIEQSAEDRPITTLTIGETASCSQPLNDLCTSLIVLFLIY